MDYNFREIEQKWQKFWQETKTFKTDINETKPKFYVLDMFPYPSGAGLHVGHPLGYIASDIYSRYKRSKGFNVLHPMGFDAFGLPAEQYAIQTGKHPADTTRENIARYKEQLGKIGFSYDWDRQVTTSDPGYYKWTQWVFIQLFNHWFNNKTQKAEPLETLITEFEINGNQYVEAACSETPKFSAPVWNGMSEQEQRHILQNYRLAYRAKTKVNWCPALGTVLANDEVKEGFSVRGGHPVFQKDMEQWLLRITAYAERLLNSLENLEWSDSLKEMQRNWIGKSEGANIFFKVADSDIKIEVFTTRPDTIYGATFMVVAPESHLAKRLATDERKYEVLQYIELTKKRSERDRISDIKTISGIFTGSYAINPFTKKEIPIWTSDYVLGGYGTGAIMAVPAHDSRDYAFAKHFNLEIIPVVAGGNIEQEAFDSKDGIIINSTLINGMTAKEAIPIIIERIEELGIGQGTTNYRLRDAIFSRQRYWGEPFPVYFKNNMPYTLHDNNLPLELPEMVEFSPTPTGEPPLARAQNWKTPEGYPLELSTMPGFAGSSAYYLRYMDPHNDQTLVSKEANQYWQDVDLYIGGIEHAVGHLMYSRFWNKFLFDMGLVVKDEPFRKLVNQGMIQGRSNFVYRVKNTDIFVSKGLLHEYDTIAIHVDVNIVKNDILDIDAFRNWRPEFSEAKFVLENGQYICGWAVEKMSKSMFNVVNPDQIVTDYGADTLRMYEMFLGPLEQSKPWDTNGIDGVHKFLRRLWKLYHNEANQFDVTDQKATDEEQKPLHQAIKKVTSDIEKLSFNTAISALMVCVNELTKLNANKRTILEPLAVLVSPFAPHIAEELWNKLGHQSSISTAEYPIHDEKYLKEDTIIYPVAINGKRRFEITVPVDTDTPTLEKLALQHQTAQKWLDNKQPQKVIVVPKRMINIVLP